MMWLLNVTKRGILKRCTSPAIREGPPYGGPSFILFAFREPLQGPGEVWPGYAHHVVCVAYSEALVVSVDKDAA